MYYKIKEGTEQIVKNNIVVFNSKTKQNNAELDKNKIFFDEKKVYNTFSPEGEFFLSIHDVMDLKRQEILELVEMTSEEVLVVEKKLDIKKKNTSLVENAVGDNKQ
jgi:hypothetical protein